jgi:hypothetical protein
MNICKARYSQLFPLTIVQNKKLNMSMYECLYVYENVYYKSCTQKNKHVIQTHNDFLNTRHKK